MAAESLPSGLTFFASYDPHLHIIRYALAPAYNFTGEWTNSLGDTYTFVANGTQKWTITPQVVSHYDLSATTWSLVTPPLHFQSSRTLRTEASSTASRASGSVASLAPLTP